MNTLALELQKMRRNKLFLVIGSILAFEILWVITLLTIIFQGEQSAGLGLGYLIGQASQVHVIFAPVIIAVLASRLAALEHDSDMMPTLIAASQSRRSLFFAKYILVVATATVTSFMIVVAVIAVASANNIPIDLGLLVMWGFGIMVASQSVAAIQLLLALLVKKQSITLTVGVIGGFLGSFSNFVPVYIAALIPWQQSGVIVPVTMKIVSGEIVGFAPAADWELRMLFVSVSGVAVAWVAQEVFCRKISA